MVHLCLSGELFISNLGPEYPSDKIDTDYVYMDTIFWS